MSEAKTKKKKRPTQTVNSMFIDFAVEIAEKIDARLIFVYADMINDQGILKGLNKSKEIMFLTKNKGSLEEILKGGDNILALPDINFTRVSMTKIATLKALFAGILSDKDKVVFLTGSSGLDCLDCLLVIDIGNEFEILTSANVFGITERLKPEVFEVVLNLAIELATQGREGKPVGTIFVLGDDEKVMQFSRQMIINPFKGYSEEEKNIIAPELRDTIKEFSAMDGAFVIREDGVLLSAGRHLNAALEKQAIPMGLGSRHIAAAGITSITDAMAIVVSESTGDVRILKGGNIFMEIEKPVR